MPPSELLHSNIQDLSHPGNSDGHVVDLDNNYHPVLQVAQSPLTKSGIGVSSGKKRKGVEIPRDGDNIDKIVRINRSPEVQKSGNGGLQLVLEQTGYMRSERDKPGDQKWNDWDHVWLLLYKLYSLSVTISVVLLGLSTFQLSCRF